VATIGKAFQLMNELRPTPRALSAEEFLCVFSTGSCDLFTRSFGLLLHLLQTKSASPIAIVHKGKLLSSSQIVTVRVSDSHFHPRVFVFPSSEKTMQLATQQGRDTEAFAQAPILSHFLPSEVDHSHVQLHAVIRASLVDANPPSAVHGGAVFFFLSLSLSQRAEIHLIILCVCVHVFLFGTQKVTAPQSAQLVRHAILVLVPIPVPSQK
jgi:hypothetical protein